jgi:class 3 adenylate cyclase
MSTTRRLAAILAADVAGYSRLMGADEVATAQALRDHRSTADPLIAQHGGRIVKTTGDGVLIEFGSVVGAVECALALQQLAVEAQCGCPRRTPHGMADWHPYRRRADRAEPEKHRSPAAALSSRTAGL